MSKFIEDTEEQSQEEQQVEYSSLDDVSADEAAPVEAQDEQPPQEQEDDLPDKYRGKSAKELARMHQEAEKALGRQGSEVGELRRLVDDFIRSQASAKQQTQAPIESHDEEIDFFSDPQKAIEQAIAKHPKVKQAETVAQQLKRAEAMATLKASHPDFQHIIGSPEFSEWVGKSKVRQELYVRADQGYDFDAANELLSTWKERQQVVDKARAVEQVERKQAVKAASTNSVRGSAEGAGKKIYRRADIMDLMVKNPDRYMALQDEIMQAYAEKRVR